MVVVIKFFDAFAGIGGFRSGLEQAGGFECVGFCEIDRHATAAYKVIYDTEGEKFYSDIAGIDTAEMPDFDLLTGGFPCQPYPEKKNIPKNRNKWHGKGKRFREIRDNILSYFKPERILSISSSFFQIASGIEAGFTEFAFRIASRFMLVSA